MNKILRYSLLAVLAMVGLGNVWAQEVTLDFTTNVWGFGEGSANKGTDEATFSNGTYSVKVAGGNGYYFFTNNNPEYSCLLLGKSGAYVVLPAFSFDVERIDVVGSGGASASVKQNIFVGDEAVSTETTGAKEVTNQYEIAADKQAAGTVYSLKVTSDHNTQITKILIWKKGTTTEPTKPVVDNIKAFADLGNNTEAILKLDNCKVTYANGKYVYVRDNTGGMCFYNQSAFADANNKWQLGGQIEGKVSIYNGMTQMTVTDASAMTHTEGAAYEPVAIALSDASSHVADLVVINDEITVFADGSKFYCDTEKKLQIYDNFRLNYSIAADDKISGLTGVIIPYNTQLEIAPTVVPVPTSINAMKADSRFNGAIYNLKGQRVDSSYKGLVIKNGKKFVNK